MKPKARKKIKSKRELLLPFCSLLETRDSYEVADNIRTMIQEVETFVTPLLPSCLPSSRVLQVHVDLPCSTEESAEERIVNLEALVKPLLPPGHNQCVVRVHSDRGRSCDQSSEVYDSTPLVASKLPVFFWSYAATHAVQVLRAASLKKSGEKDVWQPKPFGSYVTVRKLGYSKQFGPFQERGTMGRLLVENLTTDRLCYVLCSDHIIRRGTSPAITFPGVAMEPSEYAP
eukprot:2542506-Amphidinium_carterae.1